MSNQLLPSQYFKVEGQKDPSSLKGTLTPPPDSSMIPIPQYGKCITMSSNNVNYPFGKPIDVKSALKYIRNFYFNFLIKIRSKETDKEEVNKLKTNYSNGKSNHHEYIEKLEFVYEELNQKVNLLSEQLFRLNYGMTIEKDIALKILSQPGCEGLRLYLAAKGNDENDVTLVVGGVDCEGYDLNYKNVPTPKRKTIFTNDAWDAHITVTVPDTLSLLGEYVGHPPGSTSHLDSKGKKTDERKFLERFKLLNLAKS